MPDLPTSAGGVTIQRVVTSGTFELDGGSWEVDNNVWVIGDEQECLVVDAAHDGRAIVKAIPKGRKVVGIVLTHGHNDHINGVGELGSITRAPAHLHPADRMLWDELYSVAPDGDLTDGQVLTVGDVEVHVLHTPGHTPGAVSLHVPALGVVLTGDTLFNGGPGATGRSFSSFPTIIDSIRERMLTLPSETVVLPGHGDSTTIGTEAPHLQEWLDRGH